MKVKLTNYRKTIIKILSCFFVIFPWITYLLIMEYNEAEMLVFAGQSGFTLDFFLKSKQVVLLFSMIGMLFLYVTELFLTPKKDKVLPFVKGNHKWLFITSGVFLVFTILSTLLSEQKKNALWGSPTECEGLWIFIAYIVLIFMFYNYFANEYGMQLMEKAIVIISCITVVLSFVEVFYKPLLEIDFVRMLVAPEKYQSVMSEVEATVFSSAISLTFYNPNYLGGFVCLLLPFIVSMYFNAEKRQHKIAFAALSAGLLFTIIATNTTTAFYLAILEIVLVVICSIWKEKNKKHIAMVSGGFAVVIVITAIFAGGLTGNSIGGILTNQNSATGDIVEKRFIIKDIKLEENSVKLIGKEKTLQIIKEEDLEFADESGNKLEVKKDKGKYDILTEGYEYIDVYIAYSQEPEAEPMAKIFVDAGYDNTIDFLILRDRSITGVGLLDTPVTDIYGNDVPEGLKKFYGIFTGRGYAWINSVPILKETFFIGKGPGNFAYSFNQNDYVGLLTTHENIKLIIDKPHNTYLQYAINLGIPAMVSFFGMIILSLWKATRNWIKNAETTTKVSQLQLGSMVAICGFLIYSIINDSMITVTPMACILVGVLLASTYMQNTK